MIFWMEQLEFNLLDLPRPDKVIFLFLPYQYRPLVGEVADPKYHNIEMTYHYLAEDMILELLVVLMMISLKI